MNKRVVDVLRKYEVTCENYDELYGEEQRDKYEKIVELTAREGLLKGKVLDMGCGTGGFLWFLLERSLADDIGYYACADISECMVSQFVSKQFSHPGKRDAKLWLKTDSLRADIIFPPFRRRSFDMVVSVTVLNNTGHEDARQALERLREISKNRLVVTVLNVKETQVLRNMLRKVCGDPLYSLRDEVFMC